MKADEIKNKVTDLVKGAFTQHQLCIEKTKTKKKRPGMAHFLKESAWADTTRNPIWSLV